MTNSFVVTSSQRFHLNWETAVVPKIFLMIIRRSICMIILYPSKTCCLCQNVLDTWNCYFLLLSAVLFRNRKNVEVRYLREKMSLQKGRPKEEKCKLVVYILCEAFHTHMAGVEWASFIVLHMNDIQTIWTLSDQQPAPSCQVLLFASNAS